jgi:hypothetical protein
MQRYMERFGFYEQVPIDLPDGQRGSSGVRKRGPGLVEMTDRRVDVGRVAIGQGDLLVSPLQMAMVASAVANRGRLMRPTLTDAIVENGSGRVDDVEPEELSEVMSSGTARQVGDMMANVVRRARAPPPRSRASRSPARPARPSSTSPSASISRGSSRSHRATTRGSRSPHRRALRDLPGRHDRRAHREDRAAGAPEVSGSPPTPSSTAGTGSSAGSGRAAWPTCVRRGPALGRKVALKLLHERFADGPEFIERFRREASSAAGLQHPHVVSVYDRGEWEGPTTSRWSSSMASRSRRSSSARGRSTPTARST